MPDPARTAAPPSRAARWARAAAAPFRRAARRLYYAPRGVQLGLAAALVGGLAAGGYYGTRHLQRRAAAREVAAAYRDYGEAAQKADIEAMVVALDRVLAVNPADAGAAGRKAALRAGAAAPDDADTAAVLMNHHLRHDRLPEADREARKLLARHGQDWRALCVRAHHALAVARDPDDARRLLDALPDPEDPAGRVDLGGLLYALKLYDVVGRDAAPVRGVITRRLLPQLRGAVAAQAPPAVKAQLLECYLEPFADPSLAGTLADYWADVSRLSDRAVAEAAGATDAGTLVRLGLLCDRLRARALKPVADHVGLPADEYAARDRELADRARRAWEAARDRAPTRPEPYVALAAAEPDHHRAVEVLRAGLAACGERTDLLAQFAARAARVQDAAAVYDRTLAAARAAPDDPDKWVLAARAAVVAGRPDVAIAVCKVALQARPNHPPAAVLLADLLLAGGDPDGARNALLALGKPFVWATPAAALLYGKATVEVGLTAVLGTVFDEVLRAAPRDRPPAAPVALLRGALLAAPLPPPVAAEVAALADRVRADWPADPAAARVRADALFRQAELADPAWDRDTAYAAVRAYDALPPAAQDDLAVQAALAALHLRGLHDPAAAARAAARLRVAEGTPFDTAEFRAVRAAVAQANDQPREAIRLLEPVCVPRTLTNPRPQGPAGAWLTLALARHAVRDPSAARAALAVVEGWPAPLSARERAELTAAKSQLQRETP